MVVRDEYKRARTAAEKENRRAGILKVAQALAIAEGVDRVTMNALAARAGVAKGTLYLYFATKEEVLLELHSNSVTLFIDTMMRGLKKNMSNRAVCRLMLRSALADPLLLPLGSQLTSVIERNISDEALVLAKRGMMQQVGALAMLIEDKLNLKPGQGAHLISGLRTLLMGAAQSDLTKHIDTSRLPADVAATIDAHNFEDAFLPMAETFMKGMRPDS